MMKQTDVRIRGSGTVAKVLALSLSRLGLQVTLDAAVPKADADLRGYALNARSVDVLRALRVWSALPADAATPVHDMRVAGDAAGARLHFSAWRQHVAELACIVDAAALDRALDQALSFAPTVMLAPAGAADVGAAALEALCEGSQSARRARHGVQWTRRALGQQAIAARLVTELPHANTASQWFGAPDVLALLPLDAAAPQRGRALVWSLPDDRAAALMARAPEAFEQAVRAATGDATGAVHLVSERVAWPLASAVAEPWSGPGWVLLGDAAHVIHPLAGQGLNLGLADAAALARVVGAREPWRALGDERLLRRYARERLPAAEAMRAATDGLLDLFAHPSPVVRELRNRGLGLVNQSGHVKRWLAARALAS